MRIQRILALAVMVLTTFSFASAVTLQDVISKSLEAHGGVEKIKSMTTVKVSGKMSSQGGEMAFVRSMKGNKMIRMDLTIQGMNIVNAYDGVVAWGSNPMAGNKPEKASPEATKRMAEQADLEGDFIDSEIKGYKLELIGAEDLEGSTVYKVKVTNKDGEDRFKYIDAATWLLVREDSKMNMGGGDMDVELYYTNYQEVKGVQVAMQIDIRYQGQDVVSMTFDSVETDVDLPDSLFLFPTGK